MPFAKARWIDNNGRSHEWSGNVASNDRNQIKSQIYAQTGAKDVVLSGVSGSDPAEYNARRKNHIQEENERRRQQQERLQSGSVNNSSYTYKSSSSSSSSNFSGDPESIIALVGIVGGIWLFVTFMPWILMLGCGSAATWIGEKMAGQSVSEYLDNTNPTEKQNRKAIFILAAAIFFGGFGFVQGSSWQKSWNNDTPSKPEQVRQK